MFVISGVSGHTGAVAASALLAAGHKVRVLVRDAEKGEAWRARGADVAVASLDDAAAVAKAIAGADGFYALVPPNYAADDPAAHAARVSDALAQAVAQGKPKHVVLLSSIGAELPAGTGPIAGLHRTEEKLRATGVPFTALRATYFMENWGMVAHPAKSDGVLPSALTLGQSQPMVATADIGRVVAETLIASDRPPVIELAGPRDYTPEEVAAAFARALGRPVAAVPVPEAAMEPALLQAGLKPKMAALFREMNVAFNARTIRFHGTPRRGRVTIDDVVAAIVK